jgi:predicted Ser/Thr protein kinase
VESSPLTTNGLTFEPVANNGQADHQGGSAHRAGQAVRSADDGRSVSETACESASDGGAPEDPPLPTAIGKYFVIGRLSPPTGQAEVFRVVHPGLATDLVLKLARRPLEPGVRHEIVKESEALRVLEHPNSVRVYDLDFHENRPYLVMEYIRGRTLDQVAEEGQLTPRQVAGLLAKVAAAVEFAHRRGIFHRDIKPKNILVDERGEPRLIDFGMARLRHAWSEDPSRPGGTFAFMAPEQARIELAEEQQRVGARSDVFAVGAVLYFLLTRKPPFEGRNWRESWDRARSCDFDRKALDDHKVPGDLRRICLRAMAADPAERYATAEAFQKALRGYLVRPKILGALAALGSVAVIAGVSYALAPPRRDQTPTPGQIVAAPVGLEGKLLVSILPKRLGGQAQLDVRDPGALPLLPGDNVHLQAQLNQPAHVYLLWLDSQGNIARLYPRDDGKYGSRPLGDVARKSVHSPEKLDEWHRMSGPGGLETVLLLVRRTPIPTSTELSSLIGRFPPSRFQNEREFASRGFDENQPTETLREVQHRGIGEEADKVDDRLMQLMERLRSEGPFPVIKAVRFAYRGE